MVLACKEPYMRFDVDYDVSHHHLCWWRVAAFFLE